MIKGKLLIWCILIILLAPIVYSAHSVIAEIQGSTLDYSADYKLTAFGEIATNCSVNFTNIKNNKTKFVECPNCFCFKDLQGLGLQEESILKTNSCIYNGMFCRIDLEKMSGGFIIDQTIEIRPCILKYRVIFSFVSLKKEDPTKQSKSQDILYLKEDDILKIDRIDVVKEDNCSAENFEIRFNMNFPNGEKNNPFGIGAIPIPRLEKGQIYSLVASGEYYDQFGDYWFKMTNYSTSISGKETGKQLHYRGTQDLFFTGAWSINAWLDTVNWAPYFNDKAYVVGIYFRDKPNNRESTFKVTSKGEHIMNRATYMLEFLTGVLIVLTLILALPELRKWKKNINPLLLLNFKKEITKTHMTKNLFITYVHSFFGGIFAGLAVAFALGQNPINDGLSLLLFLLVTFFFGLFCVWVINYCLHYKRK
ncbi:MAG: hypothetical protein WC852_03245 [Candidatus Nanoarchaeia archaeon]|jgi:hypothetical protein